MFTIYGDHHIVAIKIHATNHWMVRNNHVLNVLLVWVGVSDHVMAQLEEYLPLCVLGQHNKLSLPWPEGLHQ